MYGGIYIHVEGGYDYEIQQYANIRMAVCEAVSLKELNVCCFGRGKRLPIASLGTCRQLYHEAKNVLYSANDFVLSNPKIVGLFLRRLDDFNNRSLAMRSVDLHIFIPSISREREWNHTIRVMADRLKNLRHIRICISEHFWTGFEYHPSRRQSPAQGKRAFLPGLLELKKLPLKTIKLFLKDDGLGLRMRGGAYTWTDDQKREWVRKMEAAILGSG